MQTEIYVGKGETERVIKARLAGRWIHLQRMLPPEEVAAVEMSELDESEVVKESSPWFVILAVGQKCIHFCPEHVGGMVWLPGSPIGRKAWSFPVGKNEMVCREEYFTLTSAERNLPPSERGERPPLAVFWR